MVQTAPHIISIGTNWQQLLKRVAILILNVKYMWLLIAGNSCRLGRGNHRVRRRRRRQHFVGQHEEIVATRNTFGRKRITGPLRSLSVPERRLPQSVHRLAKALQKSHQRQQF
jgi:hypothetical protein